MLRVRDGLRSIMSPLTFITYRVSHLKALSYEILWNQSDKPFITGLTVRSLWNHVGGRPLPQRLLYLTVRVIRYHHTGWRFWVLYSSWLLSSQQSQESNVQHGSICYSVVNTWHYCTSRQNLIEFDLWILPGLCPHCMTAWIYLKENYSFEALEELRWICPQPSNH